MSFILAATVVGGLGVGVMYDQGQKAQGAARDAQAQALKNATAQADLADQANNRANAKKPNLQNLLDQNTMAAKGGVGGTMLTGPLGVDPNTLKLGKNTLLGG